MTARQPLSDERDGPRDECGVFGIYGPEHDVARLAYFALYALQHRGQESAGSAAAEDGGYIIPQRALGLVSQVFKEHDLRALSGDLAIGHVRYSTTGSHEGENSQPLHRRDATGGPPTAAAGPAATAAGSRSPTTATSPTPSSCTPSCGSAGSRSPGRR